MLEVVNGFLLVYFTVLCLISTLVPTIVKKISAILNKSSRQERVIYSEIVSLRKKQSSLSLKENFAAYSKIQRKINKLEETLKDNSQNRASNAMAVKGFLHVILQAVVGLVLLVSVFWYRYEPIVVLKGNLFPLTAFLQYPCEVPNAISTHVWVVMANVSIRSLMKPLLS